MYTSLDGPATGLDAPSTGFVATSDWNNYKTRHEVAVRQKGEMFDTFCIFTETLTNKTDEKFLYTN